MITTLLWFGLIALFFFMMMRGGCGAHVMGHGRHQHDSDTGSMPRSSSNLPAVMDGTAIDPVCGMQVAVANAKASVHRGTIYYFCSAQHRDAFEANPEAYLKQANAATSEKETQHHGC
ncbi:MAG: YHS domain-containing protein [Rhodospirillales bacterium]|nr:YHS domain-containing protein [Rhodospirillales bacterium]